MKIYEILLHFQEFSLLMATGQCHLERLDVFQQETQMQIIYVILISYHYFRVKKSHLSATIVVDGRDHSLSFSCSLSLSSLLSLICFSSFSL